jgi:hypothetical protein
MVRPRPELQILLEGLTSHVYFQPPSGHLMQFPCIVYALEGDSAQHANNELYRRAKRYQVTVIDRDPDSDLAEKVRLLQYCAFQRQFAADDLHHYVFTLFF